MNDWNHEWLTKSHDNHCVWTNLFSTMIDTEVKCNSQSFYAFDFCNDRTEDSPRIGDIGVN